MKQEICKPENKNLSLLTYPTYAKVAINLPIILSSSNNEYFYYLIPPELKNEIQAGTVVHIPFGNQETIGYVLKTTNKLEVKGDFNIRSIYDVLYNKPIWSGEFLKLAEWMGQYYLTNIGTVLSSSVSSDLFDHFAKEVELIDIDLIKNIELTKDQSFIISKLLDSKKKKLSYKFLMQKARFSKQRFYQLIDYLKDRNLIRVTTSHKHKSEVRTKNLKPLKDRFINSDQINNTKIILNSAQEYAYRIILGVIKGTKKKSGTFLLHGVTGSGKTEVYLRLIENVLNENKTVIYLVPEIYLIPQIYQRLIKRFNPEEVIIWHSSLSKNERLNNWQKILNDSQNENKKIKIILGARSAILAPIQDIGLIVIDEAHDSSYKQASPAPRYDAIKVAEKRAEIENCYMVLGSATPNISTYYHSFKENKILELPERIDSIQMPTVTITDLTTEYTNLGEKNKSIISNILKANIKEALSKNEQIILLLNRRGYSSQIFCRACGFILFCKNCSVPLVYHKNQEIMICHHCSYQVKTSTSCPECKSLHYKYFGLGIQQLEEEVKKVFPAATIIRADSDQLSKKNEYIKIWNDFSSHKADILVGTQIVSKGLDLQNVTVVGVVMADTMFSFPDYISTERAFQLLTQVTGRAGRGKKPGNVFIQTYQPSNPIFKYVVEHDYKGFYESEINQREEFLYPPFTVLSRIIFQSFDENVCLEHANEVLNHLHKITSSPDINLNLQSSFLGPSPCYFTKLHGKYRYHILCKINSEEKTNYIFNNLLHLVNKNAKVEVIIDIDSVNLL